MRIFKDVPANPLVGWSQKGIEMRSFGTVIINGIVTLLSRLQIKIHPSPLSPPSPTPRLASQSSLPSSLTEVGTEVVDGRCCTFRFAGESRVLRGMSAGHIVFRGTRFLDARQISNLEKARGQRKTGRGGQVVERQFGKIPPEVLA